jgi:monofunctional biosynthetic peptidoglycan transglycosylase
MKKILKTVGILLLVAIVGAGSFAAYVYSHIPSEEQIKGCIVTTMYQVNLCPGSKDYVPLKQISSVMQKTVILTEDSSFYEHNGFDWKSIEENARKNYEKGTYAKGGSTISQQLAKNMFLYKDKTLLRKGLELVITMKLEKTLNKKEILERYLNVVEFGKDIYGIKKAAQFYFKKTPAQLDVVESAFLAMILPNPVKYSQSYFRKELTPFAHKRIRQIVNDMYQYSRITEDEYNTAIYKVDSFFSPNADSMDAYLQEIENSGKNVDNAGGPQTTDMPTLDELENLGSEEDSGF